MKLNPEQAVLACSCYDDGLGIGGVGLKVSQPLGWQFVFNGWPTFPKGKCYNITSALNFVSS